MTTSWYGNTPISKLSDGLEEISAKVARLPIVEKELELTRAALRDAETLIDQLHGIRREKDDEILRLGRLHAIANEKNDSLFAALRKAESAQLLGQLILDWLQNPIGVSLEIPLLRFGWIQVEKRKGVSAVCPFCGYHYSVESGICTKCMSQVPPEFSP
jgi:hypothetical protein